MTCGLWFTARVRWAAGRLTFGVNFWALRLRHARALGLNFWALGLWLMT